MANVVVFMVVAWVTLRINNININISGSRRRIVHNVWGPVDAGALLLNLPFSAAS